MALLDTYERKARLTPGLVAVAPVVFTIVSLGLKRFPAVSISAGVLAAAGGAYALSILVGNVGRSREQSLWQRWGGAPTTQLLRSQQAISSGVQRDIWRAAIQEVTGVRLLNATQEAADRAMADEAIVAAVDQVRYLGQDSRFPVVGAENAVYGYERNMYGFRWIARAVAVLCSLALAIPMITSDGIGVSRAALVVGLVLNLVFLLLWFAIPSEVRAKAAGFRYAKHLLQAVINLNRQSGQQGAGAAPTSGS